MCKKTENINNKESLVEQSFYKALRWVSIGIIICFLVSVGFFIFNQIYMGKSFNDISVLAAEQSKKNISSENKNDTSSTNGNSALVNSENHVSIEYNMSDENEGNVLVGYLEKLQTIQKETSVAEITSLIYSVIITILSIIGAGLITKIFKSSEEAKINAEEAKGNADYAKDSYMKSLIGYENMLVENKIHEDIIYTRSALLAHDKVSASDRFRTLEKGVLNFVKKVKYCVDPIEKKESLERIRTELYLLSGDISKFEEYTDTLDENDEKEKKKKISNRAAIENYKNWLDEAISHCEEILK